MTITNRHHTPPRIPFDRVSAAIFALASVVAPTWRLHHIPCDPVGNQNGSNKPTLIAFWHTHLLAGFYAFRKLRPYALISNSRDGTRLSAVLQRWGYTMIRGSSSRNSVSSLRNCVTFLKDGALVTMTPDGPRGPAFEAKTGVAQIACLARVPVKACCVSYSSCWRLASWDRFTIPRPFAHVEFASTIVDPSQVDYDPRRCLELLEPISVGMGR